MSSDLFFIMMVICGVLAIVTFLLTVIILEDLETSRIVIVIGYCAAALFAVLTMSFSGLGIHTLDAEDHHNAQLVKQQLQVVHPEAYNIHVSFGETLATYKASGQVCQIGFDWLDNQSAATFGSPTCSKT